MLKIATTTSKLQLVTTIAGATIDVTGSVVRRNTSTGVVVTDPIAFAALGVATTDIVPAPAANEELAVENLAITNTSATSNKGITLQRTSSGTGITTQLWSGLLPPGDTLFLSTSGQLLLLSSVVTRDVQTFSVAGADSWTKPASRRSS